MLTETEIDQLGTYRTNCPVCGNSMSLGRFNYWDEEGLRHWGVSWACDRNKTHTVLYRVRSMDEFALLRNHVNFGE